ncbi:hypothetical protein [Flavobacterium sp. SM2513]|uniref:hypothetical protein n=1 Tax=Flavobacterium sp. SM2513 TaxID=3424766 RepID=UPI003D7F2EC8
MPNEGPFPSKEADRDAHFKIVVPYLEENETRLNVSKANNTEAKADLLNWEDWYKQSKDKNKSTTLIIANKNSADKKMKDTLRRIYKDIPQSALTDDDRLILSLLERSTSHTLSPIPTTYPLVKVNNNIRLEHTISFTDEDGKHGKPIGVRGCQVWYKEGEPVLSVKELRFLGTDTASPYLVKYDVTDAGKMIHYWLRWENTRGETGPWSTVTSAIVAG